MKKTYPSYKYSTKRKSYIDKYRKTEQGKLAFKKSNKRYIAKNPARWQEYRKQYYIKNKQHLHEYTRQWRIKQALLYVGEEIRRQNQW